MRVNTFMRVLVSCPVCGDGEFTVGHLSIKTKVVWTCSNCSSEVALERVSEMEVDIKATGRKATPVTITLQSKTEPPIIYKLHAWKCCHNLGETQKEYEGHQRYYYEEHTCPTNWTSEIKEIILGDDRDPHGLFQFVSVVDGHILEVEEIA